jgi:cytoskeletal protein CcmA (bactofilin family)
METNETSRISEGTIFKGEISTPGDLRIDGTFDGQVYAKGRVSTGSKAIINGNVVGANVELSGTMKGNFYVKDTLSLRAGCEITGDLHVKRLQVELDAKFNGNCRMLAEGEFDRLAAEISGKPFVQAAPKVAAAPAAPAAGQPHPVAPQQPAASAVRPAGARPQAK